MNLEWSLLPKTISLENDEVHVFCLTLTLEDSLIARMLPILSQDERSRAERFRVESDRDHFIAARALLRSILALYLQVEPDQLRFRYNAYGKPDLDNNREENPLRFNLSHSSGLALLAVTAGRSIGIDIERLRTDFVEYKVAERFFSPRELEMLRSVPDNYRKRAFLAGWTRKEAFIKVRGEGLSLPLDRFDVSLVPDEPAALLSVDGDAVEASRWCLQELTPDPEYIAAIVVEGWDWRIKCWQVDPARIETLIK
jgi:4'-phosphopantetheinyl transferase